MAKRSKFFCIAVEGATCDGRTLDRNALQEMADTYDPKTYTARVNCEHLRGLLPDGPFGAYGDVNSLETREVELQLGGKTEKKLGLFAQVDALDNLVAVQAKGQKLFSSVELNPNFAGTGKAYLQGLAVTDSPASLGTEIMQFAAGQGDKNPFAERKKEKGNFFSAAHETKIEFDAEAGAGADWTEKLKGVLDGFAAKFTAAPKDEPKQEQAPQPPQPANDNFAQFAQVVGDTVTAAIGAYAEKNDAAVSALTKQVGDLKASIEGTDANKNRRPPASGGTGNFKATDC